MNEQIAKGLRRRARQTTVGRPARGFARVDPIRSLKNAEKSTVFFINHPHTTRGVYRTLKKLWKKEHRHG